MIKKRQLWWLLAFFFLLLVLRLYPVKEKRIYLEPEKISLPPPIAYIGPQMMEHPWIKEQKGVKDWVPEMARDMEMLKECYGLCKEKLTEEELSNLFISTIKTLQEKVPFEFPDNYYNVLNISDSSDDPFKFKVYQRLYLDETPLKIPFYLDVRVFELENSLEIEKIKKWHFSLLKGGENAFKASGSCFIGKGMREETAQDFSHGFAALQGERGVFLSFCLKENQLFVAFADAPWVTFEKHLNFFYRVLPILNKVDPVQLQ